MKKTLKAILAGVVALSAVASVNAAPPDKSSAQKALDTQKIVVLQVDQGTVTPAQVAEASMQPAAEYSVAVQKNFIDKTLARTEAYLVANAPTAKMPYTVLELNVTTAYDNITAALGVESAKTTGRADMAPAQVAWSKMIGATSNTTVAAGSTAYPTLARGIG